MSQNTDRLTTMVKVAPDQVGQIEGSIAQVQSSIESLGKEVSAITDGVCASAETGARDIIDNTILPDKGGDHVLYGPDFGIISWLPLGNLTDWEIRDATSSIPIYVYTPGDYPDLDSFVEDYSFGNDYLTRPLDTGASYGLLPKISSLQNAANLLNENADKIGDSVAVFNKYKT